MPWRNHCPKTMREKRGKRKQERGKNGLHFWVEKNPQSPGKKEQARTRFDHGARPIFNTAVSRHCKHHEGANADPQELHGLACSADTGTRATSSIQAVP